MIKLFINGEFRAPTPDEIEKYGLDKPIDSPPETEPMRTPEERLQKLESENKELKSMLAYALKR